MRIAAFAALAALSLGAASAHADGGGFATTQFTIIQDHLAGHGNTMDRASAKAPAMSQATSSQSEGVFAMQNRTTGTWLFQPYNGGGQN
jgi:hypothetical protein